VVRLDLGGVRREDIRVQMRDRLLLIQGVRRDAPPGVPVRFHKMEIAKGPFARTILVPERFLGASARATYRDGVLELALRAVPAAPAAPVEFRIEIGEVP
jgi:HSP20 family protein